MQVPNPVHPLILPHARGSRQGWRGAALIKLVQLPSHYGYHWMERPALMRLQSKVDTLSNDTAGRVRCPALLARRTSADDNHDITNLSAHILFGNSLPWPR